MQVVSFDGDCIRGQDHDTLSSRPPSSSIPDTHILGSSSSESATQFTRLSVLMTHQQLETVINFFRSLYKVLSNGTEAINLAKDVGEGIDMTELESLISMLPESIPGGKSVSKINLFRQFGV